MQNFELIAPATRQEVLNLLADADEDTRLIAGGTGLLNLVKQRLASPERLISLHKLTDLSGIECTADDVTIGALERLWDIERNSDVAGVLPILRQVLHEVASPRIRGTATIGGALAHADPNLDTPLALLALDALAIADSADGTAEIPIAEFYRDYYETALTPAQLVTALRIPRPAPDSRFSYKKFTPGSKEDYACVNVCIRLDVDKKGTCQDARVVLGSLGATVFRCGDAEKLLQGQRITPALAAEVARVAAAATDPVDDTRGTAGYKREMAEVWVRRLVSGMATA